MRDRDRRFITKWVEKYRPQHINHVILPKEYKTLFTKVLEDKKVPNLLLYGDRGRGKTTVALALCRDLNAETFKVNASLDGRMDLLRDRISEFTKTRALKGRPKVIILDEFDAVPFKFQAALRGLIEESTDTCSFILTCNYIGKVISALREGRTMQLDFNFARPDHYKEVTDEILTRCIRVLNMEGVSFEEEVVNKIVQRYSPSIREIYSILQKLAMMHENKIDSNSVGDVDLDAMGVDELKTLITKKDFQGSRDFIIDNGYMPEDIFHILCTDFLDSLPVKDQGIVIPILANFEQALYNSKFPMMQVYAAILEIMKAI